ncbi:hypothetical protein [Saccharospirillum salsuginis]|uniref:Uncharacterized protein n=1 Tax=Saccharospirillum salsuginis TaxID=418750 RepID=A0A918K2E6_9GAMM|nr:hypothetical protein [Saccharospirillum salsuginis]GGX41160.1 hypothetical protein GCM10007392_05010 [Saccharospirillum salsuginis]
MNKLALSVPFAALSLAGCINGADGESDISTNTFDVGEMIADTDRTVVVATASPDYSTSDVAFIRSATDGSAYVSENALATTSPNDIGISVYSDSLYRSGRFGFDNLTKYSLSFGFVPTQEWQYSVTEGDASANPYKVVFESESRAFIVQYGLPNMWVIDPSVSDSGETGFKLGEIDLSAYAHADTNGTPGMTDALIADGKLYVLMDRLNADFSATEHSYLAVIDLATLEEIDTGKGAGDLKGIDLGIKNAGNIDLHDNTLYIAGQGNSAFGATAGKYDGGIVTVDTSSYATSMLVDDGDDASHPYGQIQKVEVVNDNQAFFVGRANWGDDTLYHFNPTQANPAGSAVSDIQHLNIADIQHEALDDSAARYSDLVYVAVQSATSDPESRGRIDVVNVADQSLIGTLELIYNPTDIEVMDR